VFADGFEQTRKQEFAGGMGARQKAGDQITRASAFPFQARKTWRIKKSAIRFAAVQKTFFEEAVERGHYGGVRERTTELWDDISDTALTVRPENFHQFEFERAEGEGLP